MPLEPYRVTVHGFHCDLYGHVNNARYLEFLEAARWSALHGVVDVDDWTRRGWWFVIVRIDISYRAPATLGDELEVRTWREEVGRSSATLRQRIDRVGDGRTVAEAQIRFVVLDRDRQRPLPIEGEIREGLLAIDDGGDENVRKESR